MTTPHSPFSPSAQYVPGGSVLGVDDFVEDDLLSRPSPAPQTLLPGPSGYVLAPAPPGFTSPDSPPKRHAARKAKPQKVKPAKTAAKKTRSEKATSKKALSQELLARTTSTNPPAKARAKRSAARSSSPASPRNSRFRAHIRTSLQDVRSSPRLALARHALAHSLYHAAAEGLLLAISTGALLLVFGVDIFWWQILLMALGVGLTGAFSTFYHLRPQGARRKALYERYPQLYDQLVVGDRPPVLAPIKILV